MEAVTPGSCSAICGGGLPHIGARAMLDHRRGNWRRTAASAPRRWTGCGSGCCWPPMAWSAPSALLPEGYVAQMTMASPVHPAFGLGFELARVAARHAVAAELASAGRRLACRAAHRRAAVLDGTRAFHPRGWTSCFCPRYLALPTVATADSSVNHFGAHASRPDAIIAVDMAETRSIVTGASLALALVCAGWAVYESKHQPRPCGPGQRRGGPPAAARPAGCGAAGASRRRRWPGGGESIPVLTATAESRQINVGIEAIGTANANESVNITSKTTNIVTAIHFGDGQAVQAGQVLVELDRAQPSADLAAATAAFTESAEPVQPQPRAVRHAGAVEVAVRAARSDDEGQRGARRRGPGAPRRHRTSARRSPAASGLRRVSLGTLISPGTVITTLDDTSAIKVDFAVPDLYVGELRSGQTIAARTQRLSGPQISSAGSQRRLARRSGDRARSRCAPWCPIATAR